MDVSEHGSYRTNRWIATIDNEKIQIDGKRLHQGCAPCMAPRHLRESGCQSRQERRELPPSKSHIARWSDSTRRNANHITDSNPGSSHDRSIRVHDAGIERPKRRTRRKRKPTAYSINTVACRRNTYIELSPHNINTEAPCNCRETFGTYTFAHALVLRRTRTWKRHRHLRQLAARLLHLPRSATSVRQNKSRNPPGSPLNITTNSDSLRDLYLEPIARGYYNKDPICSSEHFPCRRETKESRNQPRVGLWLEERGRERAAVDSRRKFVQPKTPRTEESQ